MRTARDLPAHQGGRPAAVRPVNRQVAALAYKSTQDIGLTPLVMQFPELVTNVQYVLCTATIGACCEQSLWGAPLAVMRRRQSTLLFPHICEQLTVRHRATVSLNGRRLRRCCARYLEMGRGHAFMAEFLGQPPLAGDRSPSVPSDLRRTASGLAFSMVPGSIDALLNWS